MKLVLCRFIVYFCQFMAGALFVHYDSIIPVLILSVPTGVFMFFYEKLLKHDFYFNKDINKKNIIKDTGVCSMPTTLPKFKLNVKAENSMEHILDEAEKRVERMASEYAYQQTEGISDNNVQSVTFLMIKYNIVRGSRMMREDINDQIKVVQTNNSYYV